MRPVKAVPWNQESLVTYRKVQRHKVRMLQLGIKAGRGHRQSQNSG